MELKLLVNGSTGVKNVITIYVEGVLSKQEQLNTGGILTLSTWYVILAWCRIMSMSSAVSIGLMKLTQIFGSIIAVIVTFHFIFVVLKDQVIATTQISSLGLLIL